MRQYDERWEIRAGALRVLSDASTFASVAPGRVRVGVRPADLVERPGGVPARVVRTEFHGDSQMVDLDVGGASLQLRDDHMGIGPGDVLEVGFERVHVFDPATRDALAHVSG